MAVLRKYTYEVVVDVNGKPQIDGIFDREEDALERARYLLGLARFTATRVIRTSERGAPQTIFEKASSGGGQATKIAAIDESNYCAEVSDLYSYASRRTLVRIARAYCDEQCLIPLEILHNYNMMRSLERERRLYIQVVNRLAALQVRTRTLTAEQRAEQLEKLFAELLEQTRDRGPLEPSLDVFNTHGLSRLVEHVSVSFTADEQDRVLTFVLAQFLAKYRDWLQKTDALVRLLEPVPSPAAVKLLDEALAETLDGSAPVQALLGPAPDLSTALHALVALARGRLEGHQVGTTTALALSTCLRTLALPTTQAVLLERVARSLDGMGQLTRLDRRADADAFLSLFAQLREYGGFRGGARMAAAVTRRAKTVLAAGSDDLPFEKAVGVVLDMLPDTPDRVGYLLDLLTTDFGRQRAAQLAGQLAHLLNSVRSINDFLPAGDADASVTAVLSKLKPRLYGGGIPNDLADAFIRRLERIAEQGPIRSDAAPTARRRRRHARADVQAAVPVPASGRPAAEAASVPARGQAVAAAVPLLFQYGGRDYPVGGDQPVFTLGKGASCNVVVAGDDDRISDVHAVVNRVGVDFLLCDLSETGTYVAIRNKPPFVLKRSSVRLESEGVIILGADPLTKAGMGVERLILFRRETDGTPEAAAPGS